MSEEEQGERKWSGSKHQQDQVRRYKEVREIHKEDKSGAPLPSQGQRRRVGNNSVAYQVSKGTNEPPGTVNRTAVGQTHAHEPLKDVQPADDCNMGSTDNSSRVSQPASLLQQKDRKAQETRNTSEGEGGEFVSVNDISAKETSMSNINDESNLEADEVKKDAGIGESGPIFQSHMRSEGTKKPPAASATQLQAEDDDDVSNENDVSDVEEGDAPVQQGEMVVPAGGRHRPAGAISMAPVVPHHQRSDIAHSGETGADADSEAFEDEGTDLDEEVERVPPPNIPVLATVQAAVMPPTPAVPGSVLPQGGKIKARQHLIRHAESVVPSRAHIPSPHGTNADVEGDGEGNQIANQVARVERGRSRTLERPEVRGAGFIGGSGVARLGQIGEETSSVAAEQVRSSVSAPHDRAASVSQRDEAGDSGQSGDTETEGGGRSGLGGKRSPSHDSSSDDDDERKSKSTNGEITELEQSEDDVGSDPAFQSPTRPQLASDMYGYVDEEGGSDPLHAEVPHGAESEGDGDIEEPEPHALPTEFDVRAPEADNAPDALGGSPDEAQPENVREEEPEPGIKGGMDAEGYAQARCGGVHMAVDERAEAAAENLEEMELESLHGTLDNRLGGRSEPEGGQEVGMMHPAAAVDSELAHVGVDSFIEPAGHDDKDAREEEQSSGSGEQEGKQQYSASESGGFQSDNDSVVGDDADALSDEGLIVGKRSGSDSGSGSSSSSEGDAQATSSEEEVGDQDNSRVVIDLLEDSDENGGNGGSDAANTGEEEGRSEGGQQQQQGARDERLSSRSSGETEEQDAAGDAEASPISPISRERRAHSESPRAERSLSPPRAASPVAVASPIQPAVGVVRPRSPSPSHTMSPLPAKRQHIAPPSAEEEFRNAENTEEREGRNADGQQQQQQGGRDEQLSSRSSEEGEEQEAAGDAEVPFTSPISPISRERRAPSESPRAERSLSPPRAASPVAVASPIQHAVGSVRPRSPSPSHAMSPLPAKRQHIAPPSAEEEFMDAEDGYTESDRMASSPSARSRPAASSPVRQPSPALHAVPSPVQPLALEKSSPSPAEASKRRRESPAPSPLKPHEAARADDSTETYAVTARRLLTKEQRDLFIQLGEIQRAGGRLDEQLTREQALFFRRQMCHKKHIFFGYPVVPVEWDPLPSGAGRVIKPVKSVSTYECVKKIARIGCNVHILDPGSDRLGLSSLLGLGSAFGPPPPRDDEPREMGGCRSAQRSVNGGARESSIGRMPPPFARHAAGGRSSQYSDESYNGHSRQSPSLRILHAGPTPRIVDRGPRTGYRALRALDRTPRPAGPLRVNGTPVIPESRRAGERYQAAAQTQVAQLLMNAIRGTQDGASAGTHNNIMDTSSPAAVSASGAFAFNGTSPASSLGTSTSTSASSTFQGFDMSKFGVKPGHWKCPSCAVQNADSCNKCPCCETDKPSGTSSSGAAAARGATGTSPASSLATSTSTPTPQGFDMSKFGVKPGHWKCPSCAVQNADSYSKCPCCETDKPGGGRKDSSSGAAKDKPVVSGSIGAGGFTFPVASLASGTSFTLAASSSSSVGGEATNKFDFSAFLAASTGMGAPASTAGFTFGTSVPATADAVGSKSSSAVGGEGPRKFDLSLPPVASMGVGMSASTAGFTFGTSVPTTADAVGSKRTANTTTADAVPEAGTRGSGRRPKKAKTDKGYTFSDPVPDDTYSGALSPIHEGVQHPAQFVFSPPRAKQPKNN